MTKKHKLNSRWRKGAERYPDADPRRDLRSHIREKLGWHRGARVSKRA